LRGNLDGIPPVNLVPHTSRNFDKLIENVQLGDDEPGNAVDHHSVTQQRQVKPPAAAWTSSNRAKLVATLTEFIAHRAKFFAWEGASAYARAVRLSNADHRIDG